MQELTSIISKIFILSEIEKIKILENIKMLDEKKKYDLKIFYKNILEKQNAIFDKSISNLDKEYIKEKINELKTNNKVFKMKKVSEYEKSDNIYNEDDLDYLEDLINNI